MDGKKMKLIAFEGIDASGKETQVKALNKYLKNQGYKSTSISFPRYETPVGELISNVLKGEKKISSEALHMLYEVDRMNFKTELENYKKQNIDFLLLDRFTLSNLAYGIANRLSYSWLSMLQNQIEKPDITFLIDISPKTSFHRRTIRRDLYESDFDFLERVRLCYLKLTRLNKNIITVDGEKTPCKIHLNVIEELKRRGFI